MNAEELEQGRNRRVKVMGPDDDIGVEVAVHFTSCITSAGLVELVASLEQTVEKVLEAWVLRTRSGLACAWGWRSVRP